MCGQRRRRFDTQNPCENERIGDQDHHRNRVGGTPFFEEPSGTSAEYEKQIEDAGGQRHRFGDIAPRRTHAPGDFHQDSGDRGERNEKLPAARERDRKQTRIQKTDIREEFNGIGPPRIH